MQYHASGSREETKIIREPRNSYSLITEIVGLIPEQLLNHLLKQHIMLR